MTRTLLFIILTLSFAPSFAGHIAGGEIFYVYKGPGATAGTDKYRITLRLFRECNPPIGGQPTAALPTQVWMAIFNNGAPTSQVGNTYIVNIDGPKQTLNISSPNPCISNPPEVCYEVGNFSFETDLPASANGYKVAFQTCCRTNNITNIGASSVGATYTADIPGTTVLANEKNTSAVFALKDTTLICKNSNFTLDFSATDTDGDSLSYSFCNAYNGGPTVNSANVTPSNPPYGSIPYQSAYTGFTPLGSQVSINAVTGIISGQSPAAGSYVVTVCVSEWRKGKLLSVHRKDFTLKIGDCALSAAQLKPDYISCDGYTLTFQNESSSPGNTSYTWSFGDAASGANNVSTLPVPTHTFTDTGKYALLLTVQNSLGCRDTAEAIVSVYPGFFPAFDVIGSCYQTPIQFNDRTTTNYGTVNKWKWDFSNNTNTNVDSVKNPRWQYSSPGTRRVTLIVGNSKGCIDTIDKDIIVNDVPLLTLPFKDTLICSIDTLALVAVGTGNFSWTPSTNIVNANTSTPLVFPKTTTRYIVTINESGCIKKDTVTVNVLDFITVDLGPDTTICLTDSLKFKTVSDALQYSWSPAATLNSSTTKSPVAFPTVNTTYHVKANLGKCPDEDSITVRVVPYPSANAGSDVQICFGDRVQLNGAMNGSAFSWSPISSLQNTATLGPIAAPRNTTSYILTVNDTLGCPKPWRDTVVVNVFPQVQAFAGRDTVVVANQPLQLNASGGSIYKWSPAVGISDPDVNNPVAVLGASVDTMRYVVKVTTTQGCTAEDDIKIIVFRTPPDIFVPSAFTPNSDGRNDLLRPKTVGIRLFHYFKVFNRWGQLVYNSTDLSSGWDGTVAGKHQTTGTFVYMTEGTDFMGNNVFRKGTVVLLK